MTNVNIDKLLEERSKTHGSFENNCRKYSVFKELLRKNAEFLSEAQDLGIDMLSLKLARLSSNPHNIDTWQDIAGYATLVARTLESGH